MPDYFYSAPKNFETLSAHVCDKNVSANDYMNYMIIRLQQMFTYNNLPDTIPKEMLENYLLVDGKVFITKVNDELYALYGTLGGEQDAYYRPTKYIISNPYLKITKECDINEDGVLMRNDHLWFGLYPLMARYATLMAENCLTLHSVDIILRAMVLITAPDDSTKKSADEFLNKLSNGKISAVAESRFFDGIKMQSPPSNNGSYLTQFIELHQYYKGSFYNEIGLNANFNMKRESIGEGESSLNEDSLLPLCDDMLQCRKEDIEKVNKKYGTNISVSLNSAWKYNQEEIELELDKLSVESSQILMASQLEQNQDETNETVDDTDDTIVKDNSEESKEVENDTSQLDDMKEEVEKESEDESEN